MRIIIVHNAVAPGDAADEQDVLAQAAAVENALAELGHSCRRLTCDLNLAAVRTALSTAPPDLVFNLVESLGGSGRLLHCLPGLLDALGLRYTGASAEALFLTSNKITAKQRLAAAGLPTPAWYGPLGTAQTAGAGHHPPRTPAGRWIVKSVWEHASIGLGDDAILENPSLAELTEQLRRRGPLLGRSCFAEAFIDGREFNLSLLDGPQGPAVLPPAEILFEEFPADQARIVDYRAKWDASSYQYHHTPRRFDFGDDDAGLLVCLKTLAHECWRVFGLRGYARVDFRVDAAGAPWILEVNANPCLAPDAGFAAALAQAGIGLTQALARIVAASTTTADNTALLLTAVKDQSAGAVESSAAIDLHYSVTAADPRRIAELTTATGYFKPFEVLVAVELVEERLAKGDAGGYHFIMAEQEERLLGYACYGPTPCTANSFDLYWIAVHPDAQRHGLGRRLLAEAERLIAAAGGRRVYVETSQRADYGGTRRFYERCAYRVEALLPDFYAAGDGKVIYSKELS